MAIEATAFRDVDVVTPENQPWSGRPLASTRTVTSQSGGGPTGPASYELNLWDWNINGTGSFTEMAMDYNAYSAANVACSIWGKATWMKISVVGQWKFI